MNYGNSNDNKFFISCSIDTKIELPLLSVL